MKLVTEEKDGMIIVQIAAMTEGAVEKEEAVVAVEKEEVVEVEVEEVVAQEEEEVNEKPLALSY